MENQKSIHYGQTLNVLYMEFIDYEKGGVGIPLDNKFYENYIKIHFKKIHKEIGSDDKPFFT